jgi:hypothetical protein
MSALAYFFDYKLTDPLPDTVYAPLEFNVRTWQSAWELPDRPTMTFRAGRPAPSLNACWTSSKTSSTPTMLLHRGCTGSKSSFPEAEL